MIALAPSGLYGASLAFPTAPKLYNVDISTGTPTFIGDLDPTVQIEGDLATDPITGILYYIDGTGGPLLAINSSTGACTVIGDDVHIFCMPNGADCSDLSAMAFDATGNLYIVDTWLWTLFKVDKNTAAVISSTPIDPPLTTGSGGLAFDPFGTLYLATDSRLYKLDPSTGATTLVGLFFPGSGAHGLSGLTFLPDPTPTPSTTWGRIKGSYH